MHSEEGVAFWEPLRREVPGRMGSSWDGSPLHRRHPIQAFLAHGASQRLPLEQLPASAPELNPEAGCWPHRKGVEWRNLCCFDRPPLRDALRTAVTRVRRQPRLRKGCLAGAGL
jgi:hypothetical protein